MRVRSRLRRSRDGNPNLVYEGIAWKFCVQFLDDGVGPAGVSSKRKY